MARRQSGKRWLASWLLAASLLGGSGCLSFLHQVAPPPAELLAPCQELPQCSRNHVYIFLVQGLDPGNLCNLTGVRDFLHTLGFTKTYYGQLYHVRYFESEMRRIHQEDPKARFVLIGFSYGANMVRDMAQAAKAQGMTIDLLVYLAGNTLDNIPRDRPDNAACIVNVLPSAWIWNGAWLEGAENLNVPDVGHFGSPTHPQALALLAREMAVVAAAVPVPQPLELAPVPVDEEAPTPRPVKAMSSVQRDSWDFLKPVSRLRLPPVPDKATEDKKPAAPVFEKVASR